MNSIPYSFSILLILLFTISTNAQSIAPSPVQEFAYARAGSKLYVHGGRYTTGNGQETITSQLYALDLSKSWSTDSAPWQSLAPGPLETFVRAVATPDNQTFIVFRQGDNNSVVATKYDIPSNTWGTSFVALPQDQNYRNGAIPLIDPLKSIVYFNSLYMMDSYNTANGAVGTQSMPTDMPNNRYFGSGTYVKSRKSFMYYGGSNTQLALDEAGRVPTTGTSPSSRSDFCMVASEDGNKIVVFGGRIAVPTNFTNTLFVLDVPSGKWTQGPDAKSNRLYPACAIVADQLITWGGAEGEPTHEGPPEIYSLSTNQWINTYTAPSYYSQPSSPSPTGPQTPGSTDPPPTSSSNLGPIIGGVFGGLAVIVLAVGAFILFRRRENKRKGNNSDVNTTVANSGKKPGNSYQVQGQVTNNHTAHSHHYEPAALSEYSSNRDPQDISGQGYSSPMSNISHPLDHNAPNVYNPSSNYTSSDIGYTGSQYDYPTANYDSSVNAVSQGYQLVPGTTLAQAVIDTSTGQVYIVNPPSTANTNVATIPASSDIPATKSSPHNSPVAEMQGPVTAGGYIAPPVNGPQSLESHKQPSPVQEFAYARAGSKLYVHGGRYTTGNDQDTTTSQLFALDLSTTWNADTAPWQSLAPGPVESFIRAVVTSDNRTFIVFRQGSNNSVVATKYDIPSNTWGTSFVALPQDNVYRNGAIPLIDPLKSIVYFNSYYQMDSYNPLNNAIGTQSMPSVMPLSRLFGSGTYIKSRKSLMYYGGSNGSLQLDEAGRISTTGTSPSSRSDFCMVASEDGNKVIIFGGRVTTPTSNYTNTLFTLDIPSGTWTQGPSSKSSRLYPACVIVGDQFITWGGTDGVATYVGPPEIFSLSTNQWTNTYTAPSYYYNPTSTSSSSTGNVTQSSVPAPNSSSSSNLGPILGGVFGALAVIALSVGVFLFLRKKEKGNYNNVDTTEVNPGNTLGDSRHGINSNTHAVHSHQYEPASMNENPLDHGSNNIGYHDTPNVYSPPSNYTNSEAGYTGLSGISKNQESGNSYSGQYDYSMPNYDTSANAVSQGYQLVPGTTLAPAVIDTATGQVFIVTPSSTVNTNVATVANFSDSPASNSSQAHDMQEPVTAGGYIAPPLNGPQGIVTPVPRTSPEQSAQSLPPILSPRPTNSNNNTYSFA
ncbi:hypothetical protein BGZ76_011657 [Entomortierella beljakovae]|nr:hypothetical protein BGZ76_011657 [Entomortierella beljakovae]